LKQIEEELAETLRQRRSQELEVRTWKFSSAEACVRKIFTPSNNARRVRVSEWVRIKLGKLKKYSRYEQRILL